MRLSGTFDVTTLLGRLSPLRRYQASQWTFRATLPWNGAASGCFNSRPSTDGRFRGSRCHLHHRTLLFLGLRSVADEKPSGTILEARTKGYAMAGTVVRSAECVVSSGPPAEEPAADDAEATEEPAESADAEEGASA